MTQLWGNPSLYFRPIRMIAAFHGLTKKPLLELSMMAPRPLTAACHLLINQVRWHRQGGREQAYLEPGLVGQAGGMTMPRVPILRRPLLPALHVYVLDTRKGCILGRDCAGIQTPPVSRYGCLT